MLRSRFTANVLFLCGVPTKTPDGALPRFRKATRDIADEAVMKVYEYGAGSPRGGDLERERFALAARFRERYGSGDDLRSNAAPHFIGVFDTVASLGATGLKWWGIAFGLVLLAALSAAVPAVVMDLVLRTGFWAPFGSVLALIGGVTIWRWFPTALKRIEDSPVNHKSRWHIAQWRSGNYDRLLSGHVGYARHALALDETRKDFPPVEWGTVGKVRPKQDGEPDPLIQMWFAGNHSDVGGSYPEAESRLSDISLEWMIGEATTIPHPLVVDGKKSWQIGTGRIKLNPAFNGLQHCEVAGMRDTIAGIFPRITLPALKWLGWPVKNRTALAEAKVHGSVYDRFKLPSVAQCASVGPYRPAALALHDDFKWAYPPPPSVSDKPLPWYRRLLARLPRKRLPAA